MLFTTASIPPRGATYDSTLAETEEVDSLFYTVRYDTSRDMGGGYRRGGWGGGRPAARRWRRRSDILPGLIMTGRPRLRRRRWSPRSPGDYASGRPLPRGACCKTAADANSRPRRCTKRRGRIPGDCRGAKTTVFAWDIIPKRQDETGDRNQIKVRVMRPECRWCGPKTYIGRAEWTAEIIFPETRMLIRPLFLVIQTDN